MSVVTLKTPVAYYGGKQTLLRHMLPLIPEHKCYTEAFCGGAALFFAKQPSEVEVINDINQNLVNFYRVLKTDFAALKSEIDKTLHSRDMHLKARIIYDHPTLFEPIERAWALWVCSKQGFAAKLDGTWGYDKGKNTTSKKIQNAKDAFTDLLQKRIEHTQIECADALRIIRTRDSIDTFHFVDPPYINSDCGHYEGTFNEQNFSELLELMSGLSGKFMLTMFPHAILSGFIERHNWKVVEVERAISASKASRRRQVELIVMNYNTIDNE
jgi:DNA adenine methylase